MKKSTAVAIVLCGGLFMLLTACATMEGWVSPARGTYATNITAGEHAGKSVTLDLFRDGTCNMQTEDVAKNVKITEKGVWKEEDRTILVSLVSGSTTKVVTFEKRMDELVHKQWDPAVYGSAGLGTLRKK